MNTKIMGLLKVILLIVFVGLVIYGQSTIGRGYLLLQLVGVAGIIFLLWDYNRKFT